MTYLITTVTNKSILLASDTRLNYHQEIMENGEKYQLIKVIADCCRKTFFLEKAKVGIQFIGIGYLKDYDGKKYHLSYFIPRIEKGIKENDKIQNKFQKIYSNLRKITTSGDTSNFVNGTMAGYFENKPFIATFNTFNTNDKLKIIKARPGSFIDSEKRLQRISILESDAINEIIKIIQNTSKEKPHLIGDEVEILRVTKNKAKYIREAQNLFYGTQDELIENFKNNLSLINGKFLDPPVKEKINL